MLNPNIGNLIKDRENRYRLVIDVAHEARRFSKDIEEKGEITTEKPVSVAIDRLASKIEE